MKSMRNLLGDVVERRLWPVALVLVVAAIALPVYLARSSSDDGVSDVPVAATTAQVGGKASKAAVTLDDSSVEGASGGSVRNPFKQRHTKATSDATTGTSSGGSAPAGASGAGASGGAVPSGGTTTGDTGATSGTGDTGGSTGTGTTQETAPKPTDVSHVTLRLGAVGNQTTYKDVARLSALPSAAQPLLIFTGVLKDGKTVVLLPSSVIQISPESDVKCKPSNKSCESLELTKEDTVFFTIAGDAPAVQYQLNIVSVRPKSGGSAQATAAALARHSIAGAAMLREAHVTASADFKGAPRYRWLAHRGVLVRTPRYSAAHASANGAAAASAADVEATLPGVPVWHWRAGA
jgi:hypothetical protein